VENKFFALNTALFNSVKISCLYMQHFLSEQFVIFSVFFKDFGIGDYLFGSFDPIQNVRKKWDRTL